MNLGKFWWRDMYLIEIFVVLMVILSALPCRKSHFLTFILWYVFSQNAPKRHFKNLGRFVGQILRNILSCYSIGDFLDKFPKITPARLVEILQTFMREGKHVQTEPPPYVATIFSKLGQDIVSMISSVLGCTTSEYVDGITLAFMSIFTTGQPPAIIYDYAKFIADKMHDQFMRFENERVFKYSSVLYHLFIYYQSDKFPFSIQKLDTKGNPNYHNLFDHY